MTTAREETLEQQQEELEVHLCIQTKSLSLHSRALFVENFMMKMMVILALVCCLKLIGEELLQVVPAMQCLKLSFWTFLTCWSIL